MTGYLIAFGGKPSSTADFFDILVRLAKEDGVTITGGILCPGPGCTNLALLIDDPDHVNFMNQLTMSLMPAKYEPCDDPRLQAGTFLVEGFT